MVEMFKAPHIGGNKKTPYVKPQKNSVWDEIEKCKMYGLKEGEYKVVDGKVYISPIAVTNMLSKATNQDAVQFILDVMKKINNQ